MVSELTDKAALAGALLSIMAELASFAIEPLRRKDRFGHVCARIILLCICLICLAVLVFELSPWFLCLCAVPPLWLLVRWYDLRRLCRDKTDMRKSERDLHLYGLADRLASMNLFEWEIRTFLLPRLMVFFEIGAIGRLKSEIAKLSAYESSPFIFDLQTFLCSVDHNPKAMMDRLKSVIQHRQFRPGDKAYPLYINNLYHAAMTCEDAIGIEYSFGLMEKYVATEHDVDSIPVEILEAMMYRYDILGNADGVARIMSIIGRCKPNTFQKYLYLNDIILYYNKRHNNIQDIWRYLDEAYDKLEEMETDEEHKLCFRLKMVQLHIEYDYGWRELTISMFERAEYYISYSQAVAVEYVKMLVGALKDVNERYCLSLTTDCGNNLVKKTVSLAEQYMYRYKAELFEQSDELLYRKREAYRFLIDLTHIGHALNGHMDVFVRQLIESYDEIVRLCRKNEELSELIHALMVYIDEYIMLECSIAENYRRGIKDVDIVESEKLLKANRPKIDALFDEYKALLKRFDYDRMTAYNTLYAANFSMYFGQKDEAAFFVAQFEKHHIDIRNYRIPVQDIYYKLKYFLS